MLRRVAAFVGGGVPASTFVATLAPVSFDTRRRAAIQGTYGSTGNFAYLAIEARAGGTNRYFWCSQDDGSGRQCNVDPGDFVAALAGYTGHEIQLGSGIVSAATRATAYRAAIGTYYTTGGTGADVSITGAIENVTVGGAFTSRGTAGLFGNHTDVSFTNGNPFNDAIAVHGTWAAGDAAVSAIGVLLGTPAGEDVRLALYTGGSSSSFAGTTLVADGIVTATGTGNVYAWLSLTATQAASIADGTSVWLVAKTNAGGTLFPAFSNVGGAQEDWTDRNLVIFDVGQIDLDPTVAFPSSLAGLSSDIATGNPVVMMAAIEYRTAPFVGDCSLGGATTQGLVLGVQTDAVLAASESALTLPDPNGANVTAALALPAIGGKLLTRRETAAHDVSGGQFRVGEYTGGSVGAPNGATRLQDHGQISGTGSMSWVGVNASPEVALPDTGTLHMLVRGNGGVAIGFVAGGNESTVNPGDNPSDFATTATDEYEMSSSNPAHAVDDATALEATITTHASDIQPGNYPGMRVRYRVQGDTVAAA